MSGEQQRKSLDQLINSEHFGVIIACLILACVQTAHFYFYFNQEFGISLKWSIKASIIWYLIFTVVIYLARIGKLTFDPSPKNLTTWFVLAAVCGALQILVAVSMDYLLGTASRPFKQDFLHLYNKRWLQNLLVFGLIAMAWRMTSDRRSDGVEHNKEAQIENQDKIKVSDGQATHWLLITDISHIEALGNYVCIYSGDVKNIIRSTLKNMDDELSDKGFVRVSRSSIVNQRYVKSYVKKGPNNINLTTINGHDLKVGRTYWKTVKNVLEL